MMRSSKQASAGTERIWREQIDALVGTDDLRSLSEQSLRDTFVAIAVLWIEVAVLVLAVNLIPRLPLWWAVAVGVVLVLLMGTRVMALGVIVHEGSHGLLARSRKLNDLLCNWGAALWTINSVEEYRPTHRLHHRYLGQEGDPDRRFYLVPARRGALAKVMLQDLVGVTAFRRATTRISGTSQESAAPASLLARPQLLFGKLITQVVVLTQFVLFQGIRRGILFYVVFWLVPIVCVYPMILRLKTITEHYDPGLRDPNSVNWIARTSKRRMAPEPPGRCEDGVPLRAPRLSHHSLPRSATAAPPTRPDRVVHTPPRAHVRRLCPLPRQGRGRETGNRIARNFGGLVSPRHQRVPCCQ